MLASTSLIGNSNTVKDKELPSLKKSQKVESNNVTIHKQNKYFLDIEAPTNQVWVGCTDDKPKGANSLLMFYVLGESESYSFHLRRMDDVDFCLEREKDYLKIIKGARTIRIVGSHPNTPKKGPLDPLGNRIPARFTDRPIISSWVFQRIQNGSKCKAYFDHDCDLPKNYWADTIPE